MQTFLPYSNFEKCASCLDDKRLYKQIVECKQILQTLGKIEQRDKDIEVLVSSRGKLGEGHYKIPWENHPAVKMWKGYEFAFKKYQFEMFKEWAKRRYGFDLIQTYSTNEYPSWLGDEELHKSHRANLYRKDPEHYYLFVEDFRSWNGYTDKEDGDKLKCDPYKWVIGED